MANKEVRRCPFKDQPCCLDRCAAWADWVWEGTGGCVFIAAAIGDVTLSVDVREP